MSSSSRPPKLLDQVRSALRRKHYSLRTEEAYLGWVRRFIRFRHLRPPREMGSREIGTFLTWRQGKTTMSVIFALTGRRSGHG
ncbi:MAG: site-specific integrase [Roseiflexaceae bacterium]|nr:site-specific integrase [Roseiflexaceae bacterium]